MSSAGPGRPSKPLSAGRGRGLLEPALGWAAKLGLGAVFAVAGWAKLGEPNELAREIANYQLLPGVAPYVASTLPGFELVLAAALVLFPLRSTWLQAAAVMSTAVLAAFTVSVTQVVVRGINIECGCFGGDSGPITGLTIVRDVALVAVSLALWALTRRQARVAQG